MHFFLKQLVILLGFITHKVLINCVHMWANCLFPCFETKFFTCCQWLINCFNYNYLCNITLYLGGILYLNLILGNNNGFNNLTNLIQNLTSDVSTYKDEIINKIEVKVIIMIVME